MPAITFSRRHYRFAVRLALFFLLSGFLLVLVTRRGDGSGGLDGHAAWIRDSWAGINGRRQPEDTREFWEVSVTFPERRACSFRTTLCVSETPLLEEGGLAQLRADRGRVEADR